MRKLIIHLFFSFLCIIVYCQEKKTSGNPYKFNMGLGTGVGIYGGKSNADNTGDNTGVDAACLLLNLHADYSFIKRVGVGITIERNGFMTNDSTAERAFSFNTGITAKYKFICRDFNSLYIELMPAYSYFAYQNKGNNNQFDKVESKAFNMQAGLGWDHYFNLHLGMFLSAYYTAYNYKKITKVSTGEPLLVNYPQEQFNMKFSGMNLKLGLQYRF